MISNDVIPRRVICLDTETTGLKAGVDRIVQLACVELLDGCTIGQRKTWLFNPGIPIPEDATKVHGIRDQDVYDKPTFNDTARAFLEMIKDDPLVIHNAPFDIGFLNAEMERAGLPPLANTIVDTLPMVRARAGAGRATLDAACKMFGISLERRKARHDALIDAELLAEVYGHLVGARRRTLFDLTPPRAIRGGGAKKHDDDMLTRSLIGAYKGANETTIPDRGLGAPSAQERNSHRIWKQGFGLAGLCLVLALCACAGGHLPQQEGGQEPSRSDTRVAIVDEAKTITAEDRVLVDPRQDADRRAEVARTSSSSPSDQSARPVQSPGTSPAVPPGATQDIVDARTLAILATLLGSQPPPSPALVPPSVIPTGTSPMLRLIQP